MSAIEVLKKYDTVCSLCKYNSENSCQASGGEFGECKPAEELFKALKEALLALEQKEKLKKELRNKIRDWKRQMSKYTDKERYENWMQNLARQKIIAYKEVLGELK